MIRRAVLEDIDDLVTIETLSFATDPISRRSFRHLLSRAHAASLVDETDDAITGYAIVLFNAGTSLARLYSIAVHPEHRGTGVGHRLLAAAEDSAREADRAIMRLEVRADNTRTIALYESQGYHRFGSYDDYYEDHAQALRYEKRLAPQLEPSMARVPFYTQTLEFTCGAAALIMAMKALDDSVELSRKNEIRIWRESTTVFMTSGHGGCGPYGMALAAHRRGFAVEVFVNEPGTLFLDSVRSDEKKEVMRLVQEDFREQAEARGISVHHRRLTVAELQAAFEEGAIPVVLISSYRIYHEKAPHWVVVTGFDDRFVYAHDPYVDGETGMTPTDSMNMPILRTDFERMARYGKSGQRAVLVLSRAPRPSGSWPSGS